MANPGFKHLLRKTVSVFFFFITSIRGVADAPDNVWQFDPALEHIYKLVLELQTDKAYAELAQLKTTNEFHRLYVESFLTTIDLLITEDETRFVKVNESFKQTIDRLSLMPNSPEKLFLKAELNLQRGFIMLNLSQELNAVLAIRQANLATHECMKKYPSFIPIKKTYGVIQVMVGSVPEKYQWFMSLLGMKGSVKTGQKYLDELRLSKSSMSAEATILFFTIKGFINQQFGEAAKGFDELIQKDPDNRLVLYLGINMLKKDSRSEEALKWIEELDKLPQGLSIAYVEYLRGDIYLERGDYMASIHAYQKFLKGYKSQSYRKDSFYKISLCYYMMGNMENARKFFDIAKKAGKTAADPDKIAAAMMEDGQFPNSKILKIKLYTDGGYYKEAKDLLRTISPADLTTEKDATEFCYRKGRLAHKTQDLPSAKLFYQQTIDMTGAKPWSFAPNAALQLGYISQSQGDMVLAKQYFEKALSYKRYEYKSGVDAKAKTALDQLSK